MTALGDMASEEMRDRLDHLPHALLRPAARRLNPHQRITIYQDEWLPELTYILKGAEARPITRLITGTRYALGILASAPRIARHLHRKPTAAPNVTAETPEERALDIYSREVEKTLWANERSYICYIKAHRRRDGMRSIDVEAHVIARRPEPGPHNRGI